MVQNRDRIEFPISTGIDLVTHSVNIFQVRVSNTKWNFLFFNFALVTRGGKFFFFNFELVSRKSSYLYLEFFNWNNCLIFSWRRSLSYKNQICTANQWTGVYMIEKSVMNELMIIMLVWKKIIGTITKLRIF